MGTGMELRIRSAAGGSRDETARGDDAVEARAVHRQILHDGKRQRAPGLDVQLVAVFEMAHVKLADGGAALGTVRHAVDHEAAHAADAFAAIVIESDRLLALGDQSLVDHVEHLEKRHVLVDARGLVSHHAAAVALRSSDARRVK